MNIFVFPVDLLSWITCIATTSFSFSRWSFSDLLRYRFAVLDSWDESRIASITRKKEYQEKELVLMIRICEEIHSSSEFVTAVQVCSSLTVSACALAFQKFCLNAVTAAVCQNDPLPCAAMFLNCLIILKSFGHLSDFI